MESPEQLTRRRFLQLAAIGTVSLCLLSRCSRSAQGGFFTLSETQIMDALADQLIPPDEWPGGRESCVTSFIDKQLTGPFVRFQATYRKGLGAIKETCRSQWNMKYEELSWTEQTAFLESLEAGKMVGISWSGGFDREFFNLIRDHAMQAYYGSPRHGGNKDNMSYRMLQLDYPLIIGQNRYNLGK